MNTETVPTYRVTIWIAGDYDDARRAVKRYCMAEGFCATVTRTTFIYKGGEESGVAVGCLNYPRFPVTPERLWEQAETLMQALLVELHQHSATICADDRTQWFSRRSPDA